MGSGQSQPTEPEAVKPEPEAVKPEVAAEGGKKKPTCKACCACPETRQARDACIMDNGIENCTELVEAHKKCMRDMGFNI